MTAPEAVMAAATTTGGAGQSWKTEAMATAEMLTAVEERMMMMFWIKDRFSTSQEKDSVELMSKVESLQQSERGYLYPDRRSSYRTRCLACPRVSIISYLVWWMNAILLHLASVEELWSTKPPAAPLA